MKLTPWLTTAAFAAALLSLHTRAANAAIPPGLFTDQCDVGDCLHPGSVAFEAAAGTYTIAGGGANMWVGRDAFHYVWKRATGDLTLAADIRWIGTSAQEHRKACLVIRQTLEAGSVYVDAALHGNGLTCLQYRLTPGTPTQQIEANVNAPLRLRIEKRGAYISMSVAAEGQELHSAGGSLRFRFTEPFYVGLAVCAHDNQAIERAVFSRVELASVAPPAADAPPAIQSTLEVVDLDSRNRRVIYHTLGRIEAPNWSHDGRFLIFNRDGRLYRLPVEGGTPTPIDTGGAIRCNNDHGLSPDGMELAISDQTEAGGSRVYVLPVAGGAPRLVTPMAPSYWHGWSPDGSTLAYCAERNGDFDVYTVAAAGGAERRLTTTPGLDDGPDYSPDGRYLYFNSERTGLMQIWRMRPDGNGQEQVTFDHHNNWFAHPSPDGKWLVYLCYPAEVKGHPADQDVHLRLLPVTGGPVEDLASLYGGQGTINVPSWSPDSKSVAFVSYQPLPF